MPSLSHGRIPLALMVVVLLAGLVVAAPRPCRFWDVDDVREGMTGVGRTVLKGIRPEEFHVEILGVLRNTSPGRDMVLARLSGLDLEKTGVIAGMSGSPVYIDGKLLGAVAYAWPFGKEPIAGITPIAQMISYGNPPPGRPEGQPTRLGLARPMVFDGKEFDAVTVSADATVPWQSDSTALWLQPLRTPLAATGFHSHSLALLGEALKHTGAIPVTGGSAAADVAASTLDAKIEPGGPLSIALITGDFDLSGIGTVTHVDGDRVYGWGHPFLGLGGCEFPMMTGYIHTICPRQTVSFKMGSPLRTVGTIQADVSTCISGRLGKTPDMIPMSMTVQREPGAGAKSFRVEVARQRALVGQLVFASLANSVDMEGELPEELTVDMRAAIEVEGQGTIVIEDTLSGGAVSGSRALSALFNPVAAIVHTLANNPFRTLRVNRIDCVTRLKPGRSTAEIDAVELEADCYAPGETLKASVFVRPYRGPRQRIPIELPLPDDLADGTYSAMVCDAPLNTRQTLRERPQLESPASIDQVVEGLRLQASTRRNQVVMRVATGPRGVALHDGRTLPDLPPGVARVLSGTRRSGAQPLTASLVARQPTPFVVVGLTSVKFTVKRNKSTGSPG